MYPLLSVIVPVYNAEVYLEKCIDSIINQSYSQLEIILVDDGSTDSSSEICDLYASKDSRIKVLHKLNGGLSSARNTGLDVFNGDYLTFVDSDDWVESDAYKILMDELLKNDLACIYMEANVVDMNDVFIEKRFHYYEEFTILEKEKVGELLLTDKIGSQPWRAIYERSCWEQNRFPVNRIYEDMAVVYKAILSGSGDVGFTNYSFYNYRINNNGISLGSNQLKRQYHIFLAFLEHYTYALQNMPSVQEYCLGKTSSFAIGVINCKCKYGNKDNLNINEKDIYGLLKENWKKIKRITSISKVRKLAIKLYILFPQCYKFFVSMFCKARR